LNLSEIKGILFDMDGTVLDSEPLFDKAQLLVLNEYRIKASYRDLEEFKGLSNKNFYPKFIKKFNIYEDISILRSKVRSYLHGAMRTNLTYVKGFKEFYKSTIKNSEYKIALVTNTTRLTFTKIQESTDIDNYFKLVITFTESIEPKPSPSPYLQAMQSLNLNPSETLIIEDSKTGLLSGLNSNARVVGITTLLSKSQMRILNEDIIAIDSYKELEKLLKN